MTVRRSTASSATRFIASAVGTRLVCAKPVAGKAAASALGGVGIVTAATASASSSIAACIAEAPCKNATTPSGIAFEAACVGTFQPVAFCESQPRLQKSDATLSMVLVGTFRKSRACTRPPDRAATTWAILAAASPTSANEVSKDRANPWPITGTTRPPMLLQFLARPLRPGALICVAEQYHEIPRHRRSKHPRAACLGRLALSEREAHSSLSRKFLGLECSPGKLLRDDCRRSPNRIEGSQDSSCDQGLHSQLPSRRAHATSTRDCQGPWSCRVGRQGTPNLERKGAHRMSQGRAQTWTTPP